MYGTSLIGSGDLVRGYILSSSHKSSEKVRGNGIAFQSFLFFLDRYTKWYLNKCYLSFPLYICNSGKRLINMLAFQRCWEAIMLQKTFGDLVYSKHCSPALITILHIEVIKYLIFRIVFPIFFFLILHKISWPKKNKKKKSTRSSALKSTF